MSAVSRLVGKFMIQTFVQITKHLRLLFLSDSGKVLYISYKHDTIPIQ